MPLHFYRLHPAIAIASSCQAVVGEWFASLRARSATTSVLLHLSLEQAEALAQELLATLEQVQGNIAPLEPWPANHPFLCRPPELTAAPARLSVAKPSKGRFLVVKAEGHIQDGPFVVEIWGVLEQMLALAKQIWGQCIYARHNCPICGAATSAQHSCAVGDK